MSTQDLHRDKQRPHRQEVELVSAYEAAKTQLLVERAPAGHWIGELAPSALSTATAVSALAMMERDAGGGAGAVSQLRPLIDSGVAWLVAHQNDDGGWGDTTESVSNISTSILGRAAIRLAGNVGLHPETEARAEAYVESCGGYPAVQHRYGRDKTFAVPILTNAALAGLVDWSEVTALPFELAVFPQSWYRFLQMPVVSYAIPALVAIGQARYARRPPRNPLTRWLRAACVNPSLRVLQRMQPDSGGYLEATPLTSFVVMSLAAAGRVDHEVTRSGLEFLLRSVRTDGSWPIDSNLATWNTTCAANALGLDNGWDWRSCLDWVIGCQHRERHPFTGSPPGGWGWSDLSGAVPDADDTPGALLMLRQALDQSRDPRFNARIRDAAARGAEWLINLQNDDGGWPTFCRGWGKLPFDRSGCDLTAHAMRAIRAWDADVRPARLRKALQRGRAYLERHQRSDGSWLPLWFGNQFEANEENPIYGTARVLLAYAELGWSDAAAARAAVQWLVYRQNGDGGWGKVIAPDTSTSAPPPQLVSGVEETALALEALIRVGGLQASARSAVQRGLSWLIAAVESGEFRRASPIGLYFAKLWYHERLYPLVFTVAALRAAVENRHSIEL